MSPSGLTATAEPATPAGSAKLRACGSAFRSSRTASGRRHCARLSARLNLMSSTGSSRSPGWVRRRHTRCWGTPSLSGLPRATMAVARMAAVTPASASGQAHHVEPAAVSPGHHPRAQPDSPHDPHWRPKFRSRPGRRHRAAQPQLRPHRGPTSGDVRSWPFHRQCASAKPGAPALAKAPNAFTDRRQRDAKVIAPGGRQTWRPATGNIGAGRVCADSGLRRRSGFSRAIEDLDRFGPRSAGCALIRLTPRVVRGLDRASLPPTPASQSGEAPPVRKAPGRCAPAPLPCSGVSAPALPGPGRPHPRGRASTGPANLSA